LSSPSIRCNTALPLNLAECGLCQIGQELGRMANKLTMPQQWTPALTLPQVRYGLSLLLLVPYQSSIDG
jgi:hypothetical protein